ncbi:MAG: PAS domain S-box protein, partial [Armatimonadota bacterium]|nr:PAS domain S-box protein [Armatimonadota bacterium]
MTQELPKEDVAAGSALCRGVLRWLNDYPGVGVMVTDTDLIIRSYNQGLALCLRRPASEVLGRNLFEVHPELIGRGMDAYYRQALAGQSVVLSQRFHRYLLAPASESGGVSPEVNQSALVTPLWEGDRVIGTLTLIEDVSERLQDERAIWETEARYRALAEHSPLGVFLLRDNVLYYANDRFYQVVGGTPDELPRGSGIEDVVEEAYRPVLTAAINQLGSGQSSYVVVQFRSRRPDGQTVDLEAHLSAIAEGGTVVLLGALLDVSDRKRAEEAMRQQIHRVTLLSDIARAIAAHTDLRSILGAVVQEVERRLPADAAAVVQRTQRDEQLRVVAHTEALRKLAAESGVTRGDPFWLEDTLLEPCVANRTVLYLRDARVSNLVREHLREEGPVSVAAVPLVVGDEVTGVLVAARRGEDAFSPGDVEFLANLGEHVGLAVRHAQLYQDL